MVKCGANSSASGANAVRVASAGATRTSAGPLPVRSAAMAVPAADVVLIIGALLVGYLYTDIQTRRVDRSYRSGRPAHLDATQVGSSGTQSGTEQVARIPTGVGATAIHHPNRGVGSQDPDWTSATPSRPRGAATTPASPPPTRPTATVPTEPHTTTERDRHVDAQLVHHATERGLPWPGSPSLQASPAGPETPAEMSSSLNRPLGAVGEVGFRGRACGTHPPQGR